MAEEKLKGKGKEAGAEVQKGNANESGQIRNGKGIKKKVHRKGFK